MAFFFFSLLSFHELEVPNRNSDIENRASSLSAWTARSSEKAICNHWYFSKYLCNVYSFRSHKGKQPLDLTLSLNGKRLYAVEAVVCHITY